MCSKKLNDDLNNCLINFDRRVLITELLDDYKLTYDEVNKIIKSYLVDQEKKDIKYEKRFLIHAIQEGEIKKEIYKIVEEVKLKEWLEKLHSTEVSLYSVEVAGGAKAPAQIFKPMSIADCTKSKRGDGAQVSEVNNVDLNNSSTLVKTEIKEEKKPAVTKSVSPKEIPIPTVKPESSIKKTSPKTEAKATEKKAADKKSTVKKGINNFFAPSTASSKKTENTRDAKKAGSVTKPNTPKKMEEFFKKEVEQPKTQTEHIKKTLVNTSVQLFDEDEPEEEVSSDEEEKLEALKRDIISSDVEMEDEDAKNETNLKRRRILDSDEEEDPPLKQEKFDISEEPKIEEEHEAEAETYLDEDGFVITKKPKQKATSSKKSPAAIKPPPVTMKATPTEKKKSGSSLKKDIKPAIKSGVKTKQAGIMNFFTKK